VTFDLYAASTAFGQDVQNTVDAIFPLNSSEPAEDRKFKIITRDEWVVIRTGTRSKGAGIDLLHNGKAVASLQVMFRCAHDRSGGYLAVRKSAFQLSALRSDRTPLLRLDYDHNMHSVPLAHWNVHAERGETSVMLARCNPKHDALLSQVHLPVGGTRYRPCLEDFIEMLIVEFNFDHHPDWKKAVEAGRENWRTFQARAIVRDNPEIAADVLGKLGYQIEMPETGHPERNLEMLRSR
jgi:hypothetical protein